MQGVLYSTRRSPENPEMMLEIWIAQLGIAINEKGEAFKTEGPRKAHNHFGTFNLSDDFCETARTYVISGEKFREANGKVFGTLKDKLQGLKHKHAKVI